MLSAFFHVADNSDQVASSQSILGADSRREEVTRMKACRIVVGAMPDVYNVSVFSIFCDIFLQQRILRFRPALR